ncbi:MAG: hypothetical protein CO094_12030 [Anaerolineae bacterium CG_4_9_14_3_um_filter_57_17]|nr:HlyD family efflux transporter periplasmic adaptor subunit [bacterium]NCT20294.1 HlyD family efflux transporter periplasmic adaptor subunit [bacterium]OIO84772.1 MAG: hypothetical protein AUK01_08130 [Anaerolineae bacterium CG2_30_57_67]PJB64705.1 MAG: hypothetical protein CO094_12030 [Anaerolineae bacterium CG_4_9_14_3_um_filter_57_17]
MSHNRPPLPVIALVVLIILGTAGYFGWQALAPKPNLTLTASGTVEAVQVAIAPEISGKVAEVLVNEGDAVRAGDLLLRLDGTLLEAQKTLAAAGVDTAQAAAAAAESAAASARAQVDLALIAALNEQKLTRLADWTAAAPTEFNQPTWYFDSPEQVAALESEAAAAQTALKKAQDALKFTQEKATSAGFLAAETRLAAARAAFQVATDVLAKTASADQPLKDSAQRALDDAQSELTAAQKAYDDVVTTSGAADVLQARADLAIAQERADSAADRLRALQTGVNSPKVVAAQKAVDQAEAMAAQAKTAIRQAEANLALIQAQVAKLTVIAPSDGVILSRTIEPGEVANPGSIVLTLGKLSELTLTVYVAEDRYGEISLGQAVDVTVDSFPGEIFAATVTHIADRAEFTPRNVQTADGRKTTVFAIKLALLDPQGKLKPGMPGDVVFK